MTDTRMTPTNDAPVTVEQADAEVARIMAMSDDEIMREADADDAAWARGFKLGLAAGKSAALASAPAAGSREAAMVTLRTDDSGRPKVWCDPEIADLIDALNTEALSTVASCSGHGHRPGIIMLTDGRCLMVFRDREYAKAAEAAYPLDINGVASAPAGDGVEEGEPLGWLVEWTVAGQDWVEAFACEVNAVDTARVKNGKCTPLYPAFARPRAAVGEREEAVAAWVAANPFPEAPYGCDGAAKYLLPQADWYAEKAAFLRSLALQSPPAKVEE